MKLGNVLYYDKETNNGVVQEKDNGPQFKFTSTFDFKAGDLVSFSITDMFTSNSVSEINKIYCEDCLDDGILDNGDSCQECCSHDDMDHYICMDCGYESDPGADIDRAMDYYEDR